MKRARGFTLLELVIAIGIFALLAAMAYGGLDSVLTTRRHVEESLAHLAASQKAYLRLRDDFQQARDRPIRDAFGDVQAAFTADRSGRVEFTRGGWANPLGLPRPTLQRIAYRLDEDDHKLIRESWNVLDRAQDSKPVELPMLDGVEELSWRFLDEQRQWQQTWPLVVDLSEAAKAPPPAAVEMTLKTKDYGELVFLFRTGIEATKTGGTVPPPPSQ